MIQINNLKLSINADEKELKKLIEKKLKTKINSFIIHKKSLDARKTPIYVYSVLLTLENEDKYLGKDIIKYHKHDFSVNKIDRNETCIIVGYGPSGIFSAYRLMQAGYKVIVIEKGKRIKERIKDVDTFFKTGLLDENSNIQFGEGGAGTFSDAKLTTRIKSEYLEYILDIFVKFGANQDIKINHHSHIGSDVIRNIISNITDYLIKQGLQFNFNESLIDIILDEKHNVTGIITDKARYDCDHLLLGIGHSAYETIKMLKDKGVYMENKDIALGFRVEHPQDFINQNQTNNLIKDANEYFLRYKGEKGVYSFCMCPGGIVVPAMSKKETIVTNGMSYADRNSGYANSAILIQIPKEEFIDGFDYLYDIESKAYKYSSSYKALSQNIKDFMNNELNDLIFKSTYPLDTVLYDFNQLFNDNDLKILKNALNEFNKKIPNFIEKGIMIGPETRSSCPIRIKRNEMYQSINTNKLYPMGEGAGYAGGIMSCSLDGIKVANTIIFNHGKV